MASRLRRLARAALLLLAIPCATAMLALMIIRNHLGEPDDERATP